MTPEANSLGSLHLAAPTRVAESVSYLATVILVGIVGQLVMAASPLIVDGLVQSAGLTTSQAGYILSLEIAGVCVGVVVALLLERRISTRRLIGAGLLCIIGGNLLSAGLADIRLLATLRFLAGTGSGLTLIFAGLLAQTERPQRNFGLYMAGMVVATAALSAGVPRLLAWHGVGGVYIAIALLTAAGLINIGKLSDRRTAGPVAADGRSVSLLHLIALEGAVSSGLFQLLAMGSLAMIWTYITELTARHGVGASAASLAISVSWLIAGAPGALAAAALEGRLEARKLVLASCLAFVGIIATLWYGTSVALTYGCVAAFIFMWSFIAPGIMSILAELDPSGRLATAGNLVQTVGFTAGPALGAAILEYHPLGWLAATGAAGYAAAIVCVLRMRSPARAALKA